MTQARDKANIPVLNFQSKGIDDNADATAITINSSESVGINNTNMASFDADARNLVVGSGSGDNGLTIYSDGSSSGSIFFSNGTSGTQTKQGQIVYEQNNSAMIFSTGASERVRITSAGKLGIGTTTPAAPLAVSNGGASGIELQPEIATNTNRITNYNRSGSAYNKFRLDALQQEFYISGSEKMRIDSSGRVMIGTTTADGILKVSDTNNETYLVVKNAKSGGSGEGVLSLKNDVGNWQVKVFTDDSFRIRDNTNGADRLTINTSGHVIAPNLNTTGSTNNRYPLYWVHSGTTGSIEPYTGSIRAMKTDINDMGSVDWIHSLTPRSFKFRDYETDEDGNRTYLETTNDLPNTEYGLIAEEVNQVNGSDYILDKQIDEDGTENLKGVLYHNLVPVLLKAVQEQKTKIDELEARITTLETTTTP